MSNCGDPFLINTLYAAYLAKCAECECEACDDFPSDRYDLCQGEGMVKLIYDGIKSLIAKNGTTCIAMSLPYQELDPGNPPDCLTDSYMYSLLTYLEAIECVPENYCEVSIYDPVQELITDPTIGLVEKVIWFEDGLYFPAGTYVSQYLRGMIRWSAYTDPSRLVYSLQHQGPKSSYRVSPIIQSYAGVKWSMPFFNNEGPDRWHGKDTAEEAEEYWRGKMSEFTTSDFFSGQPCKIGILVYGSTTGRNPTHNDVGEDAVFSLKPCLACEPVAVTDARFDEDTGTGRFQWTINGFCAKEYRIYVRRVPGNPETCFDIAQTGETAQEYCANNELFSVDLKLTVQHPSTSAIQGLEAGVYCARIDTVYVPRDGEDPIVAQGEQWCFQSDCTENEYPQIELVAPVNYLVRLGPKGTTGPMQLEFKAAWGISYDVYVDDGLILHFDAPYSADVVTYKGNVQIHWPWTGCNEYRWKVVGTNPCGNQTITDTWRFSACPIEEKPTCNNGAPGRVSLASWTVSNGGPTKYLRPYKFQGGVYDAWELKETSANMRYMRGGINKTTGELLGLPDYWTPPIWSYPGYMQLSKICL